MTRRLLIYFVFIVGVAKKMTRLLCSYAFIFLLATLYANAIRLLDDDDYDVIFGYQYIVSPRECISTCSVYRDVFVLIYIVSVFLFT